MNEISTMGADPLMKALSDDQSYSAASTLRDHKTQEQMALPQKESLKAVLNMYRCVYHRAAGQAIRFRNCTDAYEMSKVACTGKVAP